jgi:hypothetical protein
MSGHTPGPWEVAGFHGRSEKIEADNKVCVAIMPGWHPEHWEEMDANARLIAAAPTMAEYIQRKADEGDQDAAKIISSL